MPLLSYNQCLDRLICPSPTPKCYFGSCSSCSGVEHFRDLLTELMEINNVQNITYKHWIFKPRCSLEKTIQETSEFIEDFCSGLKDLLPHAFIAKEQAAFLRNAKDSLQEGEFIVICDYAENYAFVVQDAAPGFHWNNNQATVYPVVVYFKNNTELVHKSMVIISDCLSHDAVSVYIYQNLIVKFINTLVNRPKKIIYMSDGAPQQYKNYKNFINLYYHEEDYGTCAEWHFFATAHGKGPCDGVGGTLKRMAALASLKLPSDQQLTTPQHLYDWASTHLPSIFIEFSPQDKYENTKQLLEKRFSQAKRIPNTQQNHAFIPRGNGKLEVKRYSSSQESQLCTILKTQK